MENVDFNRSTNKALPTDFDSDRCVSPKETARLLGISDATLYRLWKQGGGPRRRRISPRRDVVRLRDVKLYMDACGGAA